MDGTTFEIAGKKLKLKRNDFKLIFGIACEQKKMNLAYGRKNEVAMVQRRKITESKMTSASIQNLITKLLRSNNNEDVEDVVRLVCLLVCLLLLYSGTGTTIGWGFMKYIENIDEMKYWICEHAKIIKPNDKNPIPRFARWNITHLGEQLAKSSLHDLKHIEENNLKDTIEEQNIYKQLQPQIDDEHEDEECNFEKQEETELSENEEEPNITKIFSLSPGRNSPNPKHQTENDEEETMIKQKLKLEENVLIIQRLEMEKARIQAENDELKDQLMKLSKQMEEQSKKAKIQMEVKDVEMVLLNERIAMLVESNLYLDSEEEQIAVEVEATTPKTLPLKSRMKLTSLWATKTSSYPILQGKEVDSYLYLDDIDKIVKCEELSGNTINAYKEILMTKEQPKPKFSLSSQAGTTYIFTTSCHRKVIEKYLQHHNPKLIEGNKFHEETEIAMNCPQQVDHSLDYGVITCYLMREYVCNKDIFPNLTKEECHQIRVDIIDALLTNQQTDTQQIVDEAIEAVLEDKEFWDTIHNDNNA
ncbi:unnamed protein product [Camellia sinensis]